MARTAGVLVMLVALSVGQGVVVARPVGFGDAAQSERARVSHQVVERAKRATGYKNTQPLIGILTQPCSDCPGRCGCEGARRGRGPPFVVFAQAHT